MPLSSGYGQSERKRRRNLRFHDFHRTAAAPAVEWRAFSERSQRLIGVQSEQILNQSDQAFTVGVQKTEVAGTPEAFGQYMLENQAQELCAGQGSGAHLPGLAILVTESNLTLVGGNNIFFLDHAFVEIAAKIEQRFFTAADRLAIDDPGLRIAVR